MIYGFLGLICFKIAFGLVGLDCTIVYENLVPRSVPIGCTWGHAFFEFVASLVADMSIHNHASVAESFVMYDLTDPEERCSSFVVAHDVPLPVSPFPDSPGAVSIAYVEQFVCSHVSHLRMGSALAKAVVWPRRIGCLPMRFGCAR